jgi:hypothetical protein
MHTAQVRYILHNKSTANVQVCFETELPNILQLTCTIYCRVITVSKHGESLKMSVIQTA